MNKFQWLCPFIILMLNISAAQATHVSPIFSGYWYTDVKFIKETACGKNEYDYINRVAGDAESVANQILGEPPLYNCSWDKLSLLSVQDHVSFPKDLDYFFGGEQDKSDWLAMMAAGQPQTQTWGRQCWALDKNGNRYVYTSQNINISPQYVCPKGSVYGYDTKDKIKGCTSDPMPCVADVVARDMTIPVLGSFGHLGLSAGMNLQSLTDTDISIIQVEKKGSSGDEETKIAIRPFTPSFVTNPHGEFWGTKYGLNGSELSHDEAVNAMLAGLEQTRFELEYTLLWDWHPGSVENFHVFNATQNQWGTQLSMSKAKFRCDSFVYYLYLKAGRAIEPEFKKPHSRPASLFNAMMACRNRLGKYCGATPAIHVPHNAEPKSIARLATLMAGQPKLEALDQVSYAYIDSHAMSRQQKISELFSLLKENINQPEKFEYVAELLSLLKPIEWISDIQTFYLDHPKPFIQEKLMDVLFAIFTATDAQGEKQLTHNLDQLKQAQAFIRAQLFSTQDAQIRNNILMRYLTLFPKENLSPDLNQLKQLKKLSLSSSKLNKLLLNLALIQGEPNRLNNLIQTQKDNPHFLEEVCWVVKIYPMAVMTPQNKIILKNTLKYYDLKSQNKAKNLGACDIETALKKL